jgi:hypothetical protein
MATAEQVLCVPAARGGGSHAIPGAIINGMILGLSGTSNVALTLVIIVLAIAFVLTFVVGRMVLFVLRVMIGGALGLAVLVAIVR